MIEQIKSFILEIAKFHYEHSLGIMLVGFVLIIILILFQSKIVAKYNEKSTKKILYIPLGDGNERISNKMEKINYEGRHLTYYNLLYKTAMYRFLYIIGTAQFIVAIKNPSVDIQALQVSGITIIIAIIEARDNNTLAKKEKLICDKQTELLIKYRLEVGNQIATEIGQKIAAKYEKHPLSEIEKYIQRYGRIKKEKVITIFLHNRTIFRGKAKVGIEINEGKYEIHIQGEDKKIKYLPEVITVVDNLQFKINRDNLIFNYKIPQKGSCRVEVR